MARYVIDAGVALRLARERAVVDARHALLAPTLLRSQVLARLYADVRGGALERREAERALDHIRGLRIRLLGDRAAQQVAWRIAARLGWADTFAAEYVALTQLQADALVTLEPELAGAVLDLVAVAGYDDLLGGHGDG
ncbi:MAG: hypothetical protein JNM13_11470 [Hyphomicrobiaceae bacterium]|nr:hypothetical protein [Hyphomicrobiaceae bacterium]